MWRAPRPRCVSVSAATAAAALRTLSCTLPLCFLAVYADPVSPRIVLGPAQLAEAENRRAQLEKSLKSTKSELDAKDEELNQERRAKAVLEATKKKVRWR